MKKPVKILSYISLIIVITTFSCTTQQPVEQEEKKTLEGAWELVSGEYTRGDTTFTLSEDTYPFIKAYKFLSKTRWAVLTQDTSQNVFRAVTGPYRLTDDTYVEYFEIIENIESIGDSAVFEYTLEDDKWIISSDWLKEEWKRVK